MPPKKTSTAAAKPKPVAAPAHGSYRDMIHDAIVALKERNGSSRLALKKYVVANNKSVGTGSSFDAQFNRAIKSGVEKGLFAQPKGPSGTVKLAKKDAAPAKPAAKKPAATKATTTKAPAAKKAGAPKKIATKAKTTTAKKAAPAKKSTTTKKPAAKANTGTKRKSKTPAAAPAIIEEKKVLGKTKSGRVTKGPAKPSNPVKGKKAAPKKTPAKKTTPHKAPVEPKDPVV